MTARKPLTGRVIAIPETRQLGRLASLIEQKGGTPFGCPLILSVDAPDSDAVAAWLGQLVMGEIDDVVLLTAEGLLRLFRIARERGIEAEVTSAFGRVRTVTRGPKTSRALSEIGLLPSFIPELPTTDGVIDLFRELDVEGRTVGIQLYGTEPALRLVRYLRKAGATVRTVAPYTYAPAADDDRVLDLITKLADGTVHAIAFTCKAQVDRLFAVASDRGLEPLLTRGLSQSRVAAIGPVAAASLRRRGVRVSAVPQSSFSLRALVDDLVVALQGK